jgi:hypothetical protein
MPLSPDDYMGGVRGPSAPSYSAPLVGGQIGAQIAGLLAAYQQGRQFGLAEQLRSAFPNGLPTRPDGSIDATGIVNKIAGIQGLDASAIGPLMNLAARQSLAVGDAPPGAAAAAPAGAVPAAAPIARSAPLASNAESGDVDSIRGIATEVFGGRDVSQYIPRYAAALKVGEDTPLTPEQQQTARRIMGKSAAYLRQQPTQTDENGAAGAPESGGTSGSPAPVGGTPGGQSAPQARATPFMPAPKQPLAEPAAGGGNLRPQPQQQPQAPGRDPAANLVPAGVPMSSLQYANWLQRRALAHSQAGDKEGADLFQKAAQPILDALKQAGEIPNEVKIAASQGMTPLQYKQAEEQQKFDTERFGKLQTGVQSMANTGVGMLPTLQAADSLLDAGASTGWGADKILAGKQIVARMAGWVGPDVAKRIGLDPNAALTSEAFQKQMAAFINQQTNTLKSEAIEMGSTGRIFSTQIDNMVKASPSPPYTLAGNKYLVEIYRRGIQRAAYIADEANRYNNGHLDARFETRMRDWQTQNPMFNEAEVRDPRLVAPPVFANVGRARAAGMQSGAPVRLPSGEIKMVP